MRNNRPRLSSAIALSATLPLIATLASAQSSTVAAPSETEIRSILAERLDKQGQSVGIVVGVLEPAGRDVVWHNGGTGGYRSFIGFDPKTRVGVVVLSNAGTNAGVDDIGRHLIDPQVTAKQQ